MYKIIIADDEKNTCDGISNLVDWNSLGFEISGIFQDGAEVIEQLNSIPVDVIFTDIKMKSVSGLDIAKYIYDNKIPCKVIFISGYKEFELVHQAMKYGVQNYILKPCKEGEVKGIFSSVRKELDETIRNEEFQKKIEERWEEMKPVLEEQFLNELTMGILHDKSELIQRMHLLYPEKDAESCPCIIVEWNINNYEHFLEKDWKYSTEQFEDAVRNFFQNVNDNYDCHLVHKNKDNMKVLIIQDGNKAEEGPFSADGSRLCEVLANNFKEIFRLDLSVCSMECYPSVSKLIDLRKTPVRDNVSKLDQELYFNEQKKLIITNIMIGNINTAKKMLMNILLGFARNDNKILKKFVIDIFSVLSDFLQENNKKLFKIISPYLDYHTILNMKTSEQIVEYCDQVFDSLKTREGMSDQFDKGSIVNRMKEYIDNHIFEDIRLDSVADELYISSSQLNRILKNQTGETFLQFITKRKMEKAVELLRNPRYKVYQVGERLGYKTPRHFSKLFYNYCGYYPNEYRREVLNIGIVNNGQDEAEEEQV